MISLDVWHWLIALAVVPIGFLVFIAFLKRLFK